MNKATATLHTNLALASLTWLSNKITRKGMRGTTEVALDVGYVADAVALCSFQNRFFMAYTKDAGAFPQQNYFACIFEAKASRSDFLNSFNDSPKHQNRHQPIGSLHWCVTPRGLVEAKELPDFWGLLEKKGIGLSELKKPVLQNISLERFDKIAHHVLWAIQARRNYLLCKRCGVFMQERYCNRCYSRIMNSH